MTTARNNGVRAEITGWAETSMETLDRPAILSGWVFEVILFSFIAFIVALCGVNSPKLTGGFWFGLAIMHWIRAYGSSDFTNSLFESFQDEGRAGAYSSYRDGLVSWWTWFGIIIFGIVGTVIYFTARNKKSPAK
jgi:hypothetical protein